MAPARLRLQTPSGTLGAYCAPSAAAIRVRTVQHMPDHDRGSRTIRYFVATFRTPTMFREAAAIHDWAWVQRRLVCLLGVFHTL